MSFEFFIDDFQHSLYIPAESLMEVAVKTLVLIFTLLSAKAFAIDIKLIEQSSCTEIRLTSDSTKKFWGYSSGGTPMRALRMGFR